MLGAFGPPIRPVMSAGNRLGLARLRRRLKTTPVYGVSVRLGLLSPQVVAELRSHCQIVMTWPVDTPAALAQARRVGVDAVISKDLGLLATVLAAR